MHRIDTPTAVNGRFTNGDPTTQMPATIVDADWLTAIQEEMISVINHAGTPLQKGNMGQVLAALQKRFVGQDNEGNVDISGTLSAKGDVSIAGHVSMGGKRVSFHEPGHDINLSYVPTDAEMTRCRMLERNGASLLRSDYPELFGKIGAMYGAADGDHFNLPDDRGLFERIWDHGAGVDPDAAGRTDRGDGTTGDNVGTEEDDDFARHVHGVGARINSSAGIEDNVVRSSSQGTLSGTLSSPSGMSTETRPKNRTKWGGIFY